MWMFIDLDMRYSAIALSSICLFSWIERGRLWPFVSFWDKKGERYCSYYFGDWIYVDIYVLIHSNLVEVPWNMYMC